MSNELDDRVHLLKTIADATRLRILGLLADRPHTGRELADALGLSAATVSHHMHRLEGVGIVTATPDATRRVYTLNDGLLSQVRGSSPACIRNSAASSSASSASAWAHSAALRASDAAACGQRSCSSGSTCRRRKLRSASATALLGSSIQARPWSWA